MVIRRAKIAALISVLCLIGCGARFAIQDYYAVDAGDAFAELLRRRAMFRHFSSNTVLEFIFIDKSIKLKCFINQIDSSRCSIELNGPLGVALANIEIDSAHFIVNRPQTGQVYKGSLQESLALPELDMEIERIDRLMGLLLPTPDVSLRWSITLARYSNPGSLGFKAGADSLMLRLDYAPLRVLNEELWRSSELIFKRQYLYNSARQILPSKIVVQIDNLSLTLEYQSLTIFPNNRRPTSRIIL
ncbi:MAG: hypothetical protein FJY65_05015 [Calditrichaeota bacterium]|nr:hypothetical protein [Calditrichota bacterium]